MIDNKYIVVKRRDWEDVCEELLGEGMMSSDFLDGLVIEDAVVIRTQDIFSGPAFHAYAACISIVAKGPYGGHPYPHLMKIADYFSQRATEADERASCGGAKVPD